MGTRFLVLLTNTLFAYGLTLNKHSVHPSDYILSKSKAELTPILASCSLNDIIIISAPIINVKDVRYHLTNPKGETVDIKLHTRNRKNKFKYLGNNNLVEHTKGEANAVIRSIDKSPMFSTKLQNYIHKEEGTREKDFALGPLIENDHGNWVLSLYYEDLNGDWIELFQVITIEIVEIIPAERNNSILHEGEVFRPGFAYPINDIESCELIAPSTTSDRSYKRSRIEYNNCEYVIQNITKSDEGKWTIIGVGKIIYKTQCILSVLNRII